MSSLGKPQLKYNFSKLSHLSSGQIDELIILHKKSIPNSFFSIQREDICKDIYMSIASNKNLHNIVLISNNRPVGLFVGRIGDMRYKNLLSFRSYFSWLKNTISRRKFKFFFDFFNLTVLTLIKSSSKKKYWIELIYIEKSFQKQGIGSIFLRKYLEILPKGAKVWVDTEHNNNIGIRYYTKNNFMKKQNSFLTSILFVYEKI